MNIVVCIKQVPGTTDVKMNNETNTIIREGVESVINPFDMYAIEEALKLREKYGGRVTVLSMGIPAVMEQLKEAIAMGADEAVLLSDRAFAGSDTLATSYALSKGVLRIGKTDLIICGKQATDGDTAQVGPSLAEKLEITHTTYVRKIEAVTLQEDKSNKEEKRSTITCRRMTEDGYEIIEMTLPAVITVVKEINEPRLPSLKGMLVSRNAPIKVWSADDINADKSKCGLNGSPTQVVRTFSPEHSIECEMLCGTPAEQANTLVEKLYRRLDGRIKCHR